MINLLIYFIYSNIYNIIISTSNQYQIYKCDILGSLCFVLSKSKVHTQNQVCILSHNICDHIVSRINSHQSHIFFKEIIEIQLMYNVALVSDVQQSDSAAYNIYIFFFRFFSIIGYYKILNIIPCMIQYIKYSGSLLVMYFRHSSVYMLIPRS